MNLLPYLLSLCCACSRQLRSCSTDEVRFDVRLMQRVPYEGVSRMQTSLRRKHRDRVVRRGLALIIESDFVRPSHLKPPRSGATAPILRLCTLFCAQYATDAGRQHFADQLTSIRCAARPG